ncbi:hypothetical protein [Deinococcus sp.]|uniref:hypothetical protein n=1 Tax=Deinococcus sp. TaxID=47478 RepID=UPI0025DAA0D2|nr:hypothetical protein [Deinococcus sp.]
MVQVALDAFWSLLSGWSGLLWTVLIAALLGGLWLLTVRQRSPERYQATRGWLGGAALPVAAWAAALLVFAFTFAALGVVRSLVSSRTGAAENSRSGRGADPDASPTVQRSPTISYLTESKFVRTLIVPPALLKKVGEQGIQVLSPYLTDSDSNNLKYVIDQFKRRGRNLVFTRQSTMTTEAPIKLDTSRVNVGLDFVTPGRGAKRTYYNATFSAEYSFTNPLDTAATARFQFPLPEGSGTLSGFKVVVDGQELTAADLSNGSQWSANLAPRQKVNVRVTYAHQGARGWKYLLAGRREPIRDFELTVKTNEVAKFARYSLPPTKTARSLGSTTLAWNLKDVITAQDVSMTFSSASLRETLNKLYGFAPFALLLAAAFGLVWARLRGLVLTPVQVVLALLSVLAGLTLGGVLMNYLPLAVAGVLGSLVGAALALRALGTGFWPPVLIATALPLAFLLVGNAGLVLVLVGVAGLGAVIWRQPVRALPSGL